MKLEWSAIALANLDRFAAFLHERHPRLAKVIAAAIKEKGRLPEDHPLLGREIEGRPQCYSIMSLRRVHRSQVLAKPRSLTLIANQRELWRPSASSNPAIGE